MNISSHVILPYKRKLGQYKPDGSIFSISHTSATQFFPFVLIRCKIFTIPSDWRVVYGSMYLNNGSDTLVLLNSNSFISVVPYSIFDGTAVTTPSKFPSLILYY